MSGRASHRALTAVVAATALLCALGLWRAVAAAGLAVPLDPNEGWNAYHAWAATHGGPLYPGPHSYMINNYPPLSFYVVGALGSVLGDNIVAGRIVSLLSLGSVAAGLFAAARRMGCTPTTALFAPLFLIADLIVTSDYVGMDDPQMLAHAVAMAGFLLLLRERLIWAALLFVTAAFVKHNVVAMPIAATAWLVLHDRRAALRFAATGLAALLAGLALFNLIYGSGLLAHLITARNYSLSMLGGLLAAWLAASAVPLAAVGALAMVRRRDRFVQLAALYLAVATAIGVAFLGGAGIDVNVLFDADIALALGLALTLDRLAQGWRGPVVALACVLPLLPILWANEEARDPGYWFHPLRQERVEARADIALLEARKGPAMCEMLSFCYWAHKPAEVDMFNIGQAFDTGARSDRRLAAAVKARRFAVLQFDPGEPYALGGNVYDAVKENYRLDHSDDFGEFYVPR